MEYRFNIEDKTWTIKIQQEKENYFVTIDGKETIKVNANSLQNCLSLVIDNKRTTAYICSTKEQKFLFIDGSFFTVKPAIPRSKRPQQTATTQKAQTTVSSPMPGTIVKIPVSIGDEVEVGQTLAIVEAMKMENELKAGIKGKVKQINFKEGSQVDAFVTIVELETV